MLKRPRQQPADRGIAKGRRPPPVPVLPTGALINLLSHERLMLYRQASGHPIPRLVRARLGEIVRELDRLWDQRRRELAAISSLIEATEPPKVIERAKVNGAVKANGAAKAKGAAKANGAAKAKGAAKANGAANVNGAAKMNGAPKVNGIPKLRSEVPSKSPNRRFPGVPTPVTA